MEQQRAAGGGAEAKWTAPRVLEQLRDYYALVLRQSPEARDYLKHRGVAQEVADKFRLGFASWNRPPHPGIFNRKDREAMQIYADYGLMNAKGRDKFHNRITIPFYGLEEGAMLGFSTRAIDNNNKGIPAYLRTTYPDGVRGVDVAPLCWHGSRDAVAKSGELVVVEGVFDALTMQSVGFSQTVALQGSAAQIDGRFFADLANGGRRVVFLLDRDYGGNEGRWKALEAVAPLLHDGAEECLRFASLPKTVKDPAGIIEKAGPEEGRAAMQKVLRHQRDLAGEVAARLTRRPPVENLIHAGGRVADILRKFDAETGAFRKMAEVLRERTGVLADRPRDSRAAAREAEAETGAEAER